MSDVLDKGSSPTSSGSIKPGRARTTSSTSTAAALRPQCSSLRQRGEQGTAAPTERREGGETSALHTGKLCHDVRNIRSDCRDRVGRGKVLTPLARGTVIFAAVTVVWDACLDYPRPEKADSHAHG